MKKNGNSPIFIIGSPRSGTTLLRLLLDSHTNISCGSETHFLIGLRKILEDPHYAGYIEQFGFKRQYYIEEISSFFDNFQTKYACERGKVRWAEKTPQYTKHLDFINELFPRCQFIHIIRDGHDVVASFKKRWGYVSAIKGIYVWGRYVNTARKFGSTVSPDRYVEIRYESLVTKTEETMKSLLTYLKEPWEKEILEYHKFPHDGKGWDVRFKKDPENYQSKELPIYRSSVGSGIKLDPLLRTLMSYSNNSLLKDLGYT